MTEPSTLRKGGKPSPADRAQFPTPARSHRDSFSSPDGSALIFTVSPVPRLGRIQCFLLDFGHNRIGAASAHRTGYALILPSPSERAMPRRAMRVMQAPHPPPRILFSSPKV